MVRNYSVRTDLALEEKEREEFVRLKVIKRQNAHRRPR